MIWISEQKLDFFTRNCLNTMTSIWDQKADDEAIINTRYFATN